MIHTLKQQFALLIRSDSTPTGSCRGVGDLVTLDSELVCYARGPSVDFVIPLSKMSSAILRPSGTPPTFFVKSICPLLTRKASNSQCTPNQTRLRPFSMILPMHADGPLAERGSDGGGGG